MNKVKLYRYLLRYKPSGQFTQTAWESFGPTKTLTEGRVYIGHGYIEVGQEHPFEIISWESKEVDSTPMSLVDVEQ